MQLIPTDYVSINVRDCHDMFSTAHNDKKKFHPHLSPPPQGGGDYLGDNSLKGEDTRKGLIFASIGRKRDSN
jgi:hypothetical protein